MFGVMAYWTANIDVWFKDCKLNTRGFVGLVRYIVMLVSEHLLRSGALIPWLMYNSYLPTFYELCLSILFPTKDYFPLCLYSMTLRWLDVQMVADYLVSRFAGLCSRHITSDKSPCAIRVPRTVPEVSSLQR